ncbi:GNAT family N-acetyltransferase [Xylanimonas sp. McL0601]|uniref:GNAT family N-acetyltransferase n=1 Tax=Xylanimonas sp. McL0601 TaxID=3414739 RepID=UPI003CE9EF42
MYDIVTVDPEAPSAAAALGAYFVEIAPGFGPDFDPFKPRPVAGYRAPHGVFLLAVDGAGDVAGCGAVTWVDDATAELKRVWVDPAQRGRGIGRQLITALEECARDHGCTMVRLSTNQSLATARSMYEGLGYREVEPFTQEQFAQHWYAKGF